MNTSNSNIEPRWTTYAKAGAFIFPATFLWLFTVVFVLPKANEICYAAGMNVFGFEHAPEIFKVLANIGPLLIFFSCHWLLTACVVILALGLLERYFGVWQRYRRLTIGAGVFLINAAVLLSLALIIISIVIAAPASSHPY